MNANKLVIFMEVYRHIRFWIFIAFVALRANTHPICLFTQMFLIIMRMNFKGIHWLCSNDFVETLTFGMNKKNRLMSVFRLKCLICTSVLKVILRMRDDVNIIVFCVLHAKSRMQFKQIILTAAKICITKQTVAICNDCSNV